MDVSENDKEYQVLAELPGVKKEKISITINERAAGPASDEVRVGRQSEDSQGPSVDYSADSAAEGGSGDSVMQRRRVVLAAANALTQSPRLGVEFNGLERNHAQP